MRTFSGSVCRFDSSAPAFDESHCKCNTILPGKDEDHSVRSSVDGWTEIRVCDEGTGIAAEHLPYIFDRFYRADPSRSFGTGGAGLGLSIVKSIASSFQGTVSIQSEIGVGTTVVVRVPDTPGESQISENSSAAPQAGLNKIML